MKYLILVLFAISAQPPSAVASSICNSYLSDQDIVKPLSSVISKLKLPIQSPHNQQARIHPTMAVLESLKFFRPNLELMSGGAELFKIFELADLISEDQFKAKLTNWTKKHLPEYNLIYLDEVKAYKFINISEDVRRHIFNFNTGVLDDKFLYELYADKKIPMLNANDLISKLLVLAQPGLRTEFERLINLYQRAQNLGDKPAQNQIFNRSLKEHPNADLNRLEYISTLIRFLTDQIVYLSPDKNKKHKLVLFGSENLNLFAQNQLISKPQDLTPAIDLSLINNPRALKYFEEQSALGHPSVNQFFSFLIEKKILKGPTSSHVQLSRLALETFNQSLRGINTILIRSNFESERLNDQGLQSWMRLSSFLYNETDLPIQQILKYGFRFELIKKYINIVEYDISNDENKSPGPLFQ